MAHKELEELEKVEKTENVDMTASNAGTSKEAAYLTGRTWPQR